MPCTTPQQRFDYYYSCRWARLEAVRKSARAQVILAVRLEKAGVITRAVSNEMCSVPLERAWAAKNEQQKLLDAARYCSG